MIEGKYTIELCTPGGPYNGIEGVIASDDDLATARKLYRAAAADNPGHVVLLCQSGRILARSDEPDTMPEYQSLPDLLSAELHRRHPFWERWR